MGKEEGDKLKEIKELKRCLSQVKELQTEKRHNDGPIVCKMRLGQGEKIIFIS